MVARQAVDSHGQAACSVLGCSQPAAVQCCGCSMQEGRLLCVEHDGEHHGMAHQHRRFGLLQGFKQPLRPTQQYRPSDHELQDVVLCYDIPPVRPCKKCGGSDWLLNLAVTRGQAVTEAKPRKLIIYTSSGKDELSCCALCTHCGALLMPNPSSLSRLRSLLLLSLFLH